MFACEIRSLQYNTIQYKFYCQLPWVLKSGIQLGESGIPPTIEIRNPSSIDQEASNSLGRGKKSRGQYGGCQFWSEKNILKATVMLMVQGLRQSKWDSGRITSTEKLTELLQCSLIEI